MRSSSKGSMFAVFGLAIWAGPAAAAGNDAALRCAALGDDQARLACYDGLFRTGDSAALQATAAAAAQAGAGTAPPSVAAGPAAPTAAAAAVAASGTVPAADPVADFGLTPTQMRSLDPERAAEPRAPQSVSGTVSKVGYKASGEMVVTLENGQVWMQIDTGSRPRIKEGDTVTIKRGTLGSYLLVSPSRMATRVRRLK